MNSGESIRFLCRRARCAARHVVRRVPKFLRLTEQGCLVPDDFIGVTHEKDIVSMQAYAKARERAVDYVRRSFQKVTPTRFRSSCLRTRPVFEHGRTGAQKSFQIPLLCSNRVNPILKCS